MSTPRAENPLLAPYGTPNPSRNDISIQDIAQESLAPGNVLDDGNNNITTGSLQTRTLQAAIGRLPVAGQEGDEAAWGSNFWVTLVDPQVMSFIVGLGTLTAFRTPDSDVLFCLPCDRPSKLGSPSW